MTGKPQRRGHVDDSFNQLGFLMLRHRGIVALEFGGSEAIAIFQRRVRHRVNPKRGNSFTPHSPPTDLPSASPASAAAATPQGFGFRVSVTATFAPAFALVT